jgi:integrase
MPREKLPVTIRWVEAFAKQAVEDDLHHLAALCLFMFGTGARLGEACALTWGDVELFQKKAVINQTKIDDQRVAHLSPPVIAALANIPSNRKPDSLVFHYAFGESVGQVWNNVVGRAGIEKLSPHCCPHGFATSMLQAGKSKDCCGTRRLERRWNSYEILCPCDGRSDCHGCAFWHKIDTRRKRLSDK